MITLELIGIFGIEIALYASMVIWMKRRMAKRIQRREVRRDLYDTTKRVFSLGC